MDNTLPSPTSPLPTLPSTIPTPPPPPSHKPIYFYPLLISLVFILGFLGYYVYLYSTGYELPTTIPQLLSSPIPRASALPTSSTEPSLSTYPPMENTENKLVYLRDPDPNGTYDYQAWLLDPATGDEELLPIENFTQAYKFLGSTKLFYLPVSDEGEFRILDLATGEETPHFLMAHPDPAVLENLSLNSILDISPDGKWLVFQVGFNLVCPSPSPFPSGFEGGYGPCQPDENLSTPTGNYLYNFSNQTATALTELFRVSRWDTTNQKLYYVTNNATKAIDLTTKSISMIDSTSYFGYYTLPLFKTHRLVKFEGATGDSSTPAISRDYLLNLDNQESTTIESLDSWATLQPFFAISPEETDLLYVRAVNHSDGISRYYLHRFNLLNNTSTLLTPEDSNLSYSNYGTWLDNHTYITLVDTIESDNYSNINNYLVKIDLETREISRLTPHDLVYRFNTN